MFSVTEPLVGLVLKTPPPAPLVPLAVFGDDGGECQGGRACGEEASSLGGVAAGGSFAMGAGIVGFAITTVSAKVQDEVCVGFVRHLGRYLDGAEALGSEVDPRAPRDGGAERLSPGEEGRTVE